MFTGIIEEVGQLRNTSQKGQAMILSIQAKRILEDIHLGDSISVNGVCLTVTGFDSSHFTLDVMPETYRKSNLRQLSNGSIVNLERAMIANGRFGGHIVQGHVDGIGKIKQRYTEENAVVFKIEPEDAALYQYMIDQGSIALDGISLTIVKVHESSFTVSMIPHTISQTTWQNKQVGDTVNIECDLLGKYVKRLLQYQDTSTKSLSKEWLAEKGFM